MHFPSAGLICLRIRSMPVIVGSTCGIRAKFRKNLARDASAVLQPLGDDVYDRDLGRRQQA